MLRSQHAEHVPRPWRRETEFPESLSCFWIKALFDFQHELPDLGKRVSGENSRSYHITASPCYALVRNDLSWTVVGRLSLFLFHHAILRTVSEGPKDEAPCVFLTSNLHARVLCSSSTAFAESYPLAASRQPLRSGGSPTYHASFNRCIHNRECQESQLGGACKR